MEKKGVLDFLSTFVRQQKSEVNYGTYKDTKRSSLLKDGLDTRANSVWKQSQFVVAYREESDNATTEAVLKGWGELTRGVFDQYLILEEPKGEWTVYDKHGNNRGGVEFLKSVPQHESYLSGAGVSIELDTSSSDNYIKYLTALRTKPFLLLAGISGTGKSRIVRELAFNSCPKELQDRDKTTPGNYCMIEVKPNWHDSTELLGYWSNINKKYVFTKFVKFLVKAKMFPDVPFFVCLDEMNLAPVEQYFAEFLSVLETRCLQEDGTVKSGVLVDKEYFIDLAKSKTIRDQDGNQKQILKNDREIYFKLFDINDRDAMESIKMERRDLLEDGLTLPDNVYVIGTVNMDDTTHQFSRKVIDRAMTIEMNGGDLADIFKSGSSLTYSDNPMTMDDLKSRYVSATDVLNKCDAVEKNQDIRNFIQGIGNDGLPQRLEKINNVLKGTPFAVSYRVMNELTIFLGVLLDKAVQDGIDMTFEIFKRYVEKAIDRMLLMKILPRVEGDDEMFRITEDEKSRNNLVDRSSGDNNYDYTKLDWLRDIAPQRNKKCQEGAEYEGADDRLDTQAVDKTYMAIDKLNEMITRLHRQNFTRYWP